MSDRTPHHRWIAWWRQHITASQTQPYGLPAGEMQELAAYNSERTRGLLHTPEHQARMANLQAIFDREQKKPDLPPTVMRGEKH